MYECMYECMYESMYESMYECTYKRMHKCIYNNMYVYIWATVIADSITSGSILSGFINSSARKFISAQPSNAHRQATNAVKKPANPR